MQIRNSPDASQCEYSLPEGIAGTRATLRLMARLVRETRTDQAIRQCAADLLAMLPDQGFRQEIETIFNYVRDEIRYLQDCVGVEVVQNPRVTLDFRQGDCDDKSTLLAALLESVGHPCAFVAVGYTRPGEFEHVYVETRVGRRWIALDATLSMPAGFAPLYPNVEARTTALMREFI